MKIRDATKVMYVVCLLSVSGCNDNADNASLDENVGEVGVAKIVAGAELPEFSLASLNSPSDSFTPRDLSGKVYLIDFWATWCLPCVAELPNLHQAYETYADDGFEILSVAMGDDRETIADLRETQWPMPWLHAFEPLDSEAAELFELFGIPKAILVDSNNTILGVDEDVRGDNLQEMLGRLFGKTN
jgi:thiol-disulfide isomerase/thioredoxin